MNKKYLLTLGTLGAVTLVMVSPSSVSAFGGFGPRDGQKPEGMIGKMRGEHRGEGLVPQEMREEFKGDFQNLSEEERAQMREEHQARRGEHKAEMEEFTGKTREEMREARQSGQTMGEVLEENGKSQEDAEAFLTQRVNEKVDHITEKHDLDESQVETIRARVGDFVQKILGKWFGN